MILGIDKLHKLVKDKKLVENLCERELNNPEGAGFDLRLGEVYKLTSGGFLGIDDRKTCDVELVAQYNPERRDSLVLKPGDFCIVKTLEKVNLPSDLVGIFKPRSTLHRMGLYLRTAQVAPGYSGELNFALTNLGNQTIKIELGARIVHIMFIRVDGKSKMYRGQWQGGRVTTKKREKQI